MRTNRTSLFAYVAIAALGVAATSMTASEAAAGIFCNRSFGGGFATCARNYSPAPVPRKGRRPPAAPGGEQARRLAAPRKPAPAEPAKVASTASTAAAAAAEVAQAAGTANANCAHRDPVPDQASTSRPAP